MNCTSVLAHLGGPVYYSSERERNNVNYVLLTIVTEASPNVCLMFDLCFIASAFLLHHPRRNQRTSSKFQIECGLISAKNKIVARYTRRARLGRHGPRGEHRKFLCTTRDACPMNNNTILIIIIERFSNDCRKTQTKEITPTNHNRSKQRDGQITIPSKYL